MNLLVCSTLFSARNNSWPKKIFAKKWPTWRMWWCAAGDLYLLKKSPSLCRKRLLLNTAAAPLGIGCRCIGYEEDVWEAVGAHGLSKTLCVESTSQRRAGFCPISEAAETADATERTVEFSKCKGELRQNRSRSRHTSLFVLQMFIQMVIGLGATVELTSIAFIIFSQKGLVH